jgi:hypothetical protein
MVISRREASLIIKALDDLWAYECIESPELPRPTQDWFNELEGLVTKMVKHRTRAIRTATSCNIEVDDTRAPWQ